MNQPATPLQAELQAVQWPLLGGDVSLDFVNTAEHLGKAQPVELLTSPQRLLAWCHHAQLLPERELLRLARAAARDPVQAQQLLGRALALRGALRRALAGLVQHEPPAGSTLKPLNDTLRAVTPQRQLQALGGDGTAAAWAWRADADATAHVLGPVCLAAAQLLTSPGLSKLRQCTGCGWFFLDTSRNHSRRWCSMAFCGGQMKSKRQYQRRLEARE